MSISLKRHFFLVETNNNKVIFIDVTEKKNEIASGKSFLSSPNKKNAWYTSN